MWKGEGWDRVLAVKKMDTTGTFRKESREYEGGEFGVDYEGRKDQFWMGEDKRWW